MQKILEYLHQGADIFITNKEGKGKLIYLDEQWNVQII